MSAFYVLLFRDSEKGVYALYKYVLKRILLMIPVMLLVTVLVFTINYFSTGDPVAQILGAEATQEQIDAKRAELGLDQPYFVQLWEYIKNIITKFDFGSSYKTGAPVINEVLERAPTTLLLTICSMAFATVIGITLGIVSAVKQYSIFDYIATFLSLVGASMPSFWLGLMLMLVFALNLGIFPASGFTGPKYIVLPAIAVSMIPISTITRTTRSAMLEVIRQDYMRTARAKGLGEYKVIMKHGLKNALIPVVTILGIQLGRTLGGSIVTESIFAIPGLGSLLVTSIYSKNYPSIQGTVLFCALAFCIINLVVDVLYAYIDPRIKSQYVKPKARLKLAETAVADAVARGTSEEERA